MYARQALACEKQVTFFTRQPATKFPLNLYNLLKMSKNCEKSLQNHPGCGKMVAAAYAEAKTR